MTNKPIYLRTFRELISDRTLLDETYEQWLARLRAENQMEDRHAWQEYDAAAMELARKGLKGKLGDPLPMLMSARTVQLINDDPEAFEERVRQSAYALAMESSNIRAENRESERQRVEAQQADAETAVDRDIRHRMDDYYRVDDSE